LGLNQATIAAAGIGMTLAVTLGMASCARVAASRLILLLLVPAAALSSPPGDGGETARQNFVRAEQALRRGDAEEYRRLQEQLADYPLLPYLDYLELSADWDKASGAEVERFLERHQDTPLAAQARRAWLNRLAESARWEDFLRFYRDGDSARRKCQYLTALIRTGESSEALKQVEPLWLNGHSQPEACDPVFQEWIANGLLTPELVWGRITLAMDSGNGALARYLRQFLGDADRRWLDLWLEVDADPEVLRDSARFADPHPYRSRILVHGVGRASERDPDGAASLWRMWREDGQLSPADRCAGDTAVAFGQAAKGTGEALAGLDPLDPCLDSPRLRERRLRAAIGLSDWGRLLRWIDALPDDEKEGEPWRYWGARARQALGDPSAADSLLRDLARERSYYGFLAAARSGLSAHIGHQPVATDPDLEQRIESSLPAQRARELLALDRAAWSRREWRELTAELDAAGLRAAALVAHRWGWHDQAIFTLARAGYWDDLVLRFPLAHASLIEEQAGRHGLDPAWIYAVLRQESAFATDVRSPAGAVGLMQLLPSTAREVASLEGLSDPGHLDLVDPALNIALGSAYLARIHRQFRGHPLLATAAYNAGPGRVESWLPGTPTEADQWVESIPFRETRQYVQRVLTYLVIYQSRLGREPVPMTELLAPVGPPSGPADSAHLRGDALSPAG